MKKIENQDNLYNQYLIFGIIGSISGTIIAVFNIVFNVVTSTIAPINNIIIVFSFIYMPVIIIALFFAAKWNQVYKQTIDFPVKFMYALKLAGVTGLYQNNRGNFSQIKDTLRGDTQIGKVYKVKIILYHGYELLRSIEKLLEKIITESINNEVKIIIAEDNGDLINDVWNMESVHSGDPITAIKKDGQKHQKEAFEIIKKLKKLAISTHKHFDYKRFTTQVRYSVIIINNVWAWWTPYHTGLTVPETMSFVLEKEVKANEETICGQCLGHFNSLWKILPDPPINEIQNVTAITKKGAKP
ncbi:hypothetical protein [Treponema sp. R80B11-R83G3]